MLIANGLRKVDMQDLLVFLQVHQRQNLVEVAEHLSLSPSTVSCEEAAPGLRRRAVHRHPRRHAADPQESRHAAPCGGNACPHKRLSRRPGQLRPAWRAAYLYPLRAGIRRAADPSGTPATARRQRPEDRPGHPPPGSRTAHRSIARRPGRPGLRLRSRVPPTGTGATGARPVQRRTALRAGSCPAAPRAPGTGRVLPAPLRLPDPARRQQRQPGGHVAATPGPQPRSRRARQQLRRRPATAVGQRLRADAAATYPRAARRWPPSRLPRTVRAAAVRPAPVMEPCRRPGPGEPGCANRC